MKQKLITVTAFAYKHDVKPQAIWYMFKDIIQYDKGRALIPANTKYHPRRKLKK